MCVSWCSAGLGLKFRVRGEWNLGWNHGTQRTERARTHGYRKQGRNTETGTGKVDLFGSHGAVVGY